MKTEQFVVKSTINDNTVLTYQHTDNEDENWISAGYKKIAQLTKLDPLSVRARYYVSRQ